MKASFKQQTRDILGPLHTLRSLLHQPSYFVSNPDLVHHHGFQSLERDLLCTDGADDDLGFMRNDMNRSNI